jgi:hypothetical protein
MVMNNLCKPSCRLSLAAFCLLLIFCFTTTIAVHPGPAAASEADTLAKTIDKELRNAERLMFNGKKEEADEKLEAAGAMITDLKAMDPGNTKLKSLESKYNRTRQTLDKRLGKTTMTSSERPLPPKPQTQASSSAGPAAAQTEAAAEQEAKLPGGVKKRLSDIEGTLNQVERQLSNNRIKNARFELDKIPGFFEEIDKMYSGQFSTDNPDYQAVQKRYGEMQAKVEAASEAEAQVQADAAKAAEANKAMAKKWIDRFGHYISASYLPPGHKPDKEVIFPGTADPEKIPQMQKIYEEAKAVYAEYEKSGLASSSDIPWDLEQAAKDLKYALESYESSYRSAMDGYAREAESSVDQALDFLAGTDWKTDPEALPPMISKDRMDRIDGLIKNLDTVLAPDDPKLAGLKAKQAEIVQQDKEHRKIWQERVRVRPEIYKGSDLADIRAKAESIVKKEKPGAEILRISVYKDEWQEESVIESTDSTNTALRHRVTRMINAQVATKQNNEVLLNTLHIAKDKQSDGSWTKLYGHIMHSDKMLEANVDR